MSLEAFIRRETAQLGFAAVGFAAVGPCRTFGRFQDWLGRGYHAGMDYLARRAELRANPGLVAPGARSVIVVAARYPAAARRGSFSSYALGRDYHDVLRGKLRQLVRRLNGLGRPLRTARICVDSAPVLEREWAVRAGLGWIGRQGCLVNPEWGCKLVLGELFVDLELPAAVPLAGQCGDCRRCADACPTGAIQPDGCVDARRCISYLTIEHKGDIPKPLRPLIGASIFGCDRCTDACPYNRPGADAVLPEFDPVASSMPTAEQCLDMNEADFRKTFRGTAVYRSGLARLRRNAAIAVSNRGI